MFNVNDVKRLVIKIGTSVLADDQLRFHEAFFARLAERVSSLKHRSIEVLIVTSGAIAAGRAELGLSSKPKTLAVQQAAAAVGQIQLMRSYHKAFAKEDLKVAQILLTHGDFQSRKRFLNARQTLLKLLQFDVVPFVNENDTVSVEEILVGDNDNLSALVATLVDADLLLMICDVDGLYTADPSQDQKAQRIPIVDDLEKVFSYAQGTNNPGSTGGMHTKLEASQHAAAFGIPTLISNDEVLDRLEGLFDGEDVGTLILPQKRLQSRKHWIVHTLKPLGKISVDQGAIQALCEMGKSLLPAGVVSVEGHFGPGDPVDIVGPDGKPIARGLVSYSAAEIERIRGRRSSEIKDALGYKTQDEIIHRNHLALLG